MISVLLMLLALETPALADAQASYEQGLDALRAEDYATAESHLLEALETGSQDPALYHALGNTLYRKQDYGRALVAWERGMRLAPRNGDLKANADHTRRALGMDLDTAGQSTHLAWNRWLTPWESAMSSGLLLFLGFSALLVRRQRHTPEGRSWGWETPACLALGLVLAASTWEAASLEAGHIIVGEEVTARSAMGAQGVALFELGPGTATTVVEYSGQHVLVLLEDGRKGWLPAQSVLSCRPGDPFSPPR
jgi:tetratricopeptide (TPR) repeat protein